MASINMEEEGNKKEIVKPIVLHHLTQNIDLQEKWSQDGKFMSSLREIIFSIKRVFQDESSERTRIYQVWPGKNVHLME